MFPLNFFGPVGGDLSATIIARPVIQDVTLFQNEAIPQVWTFLDVNGNPIPLNGQSINLRAFSFDGVTVTPVFTQSGIVGSSPYNTVTVTFHPSQTATSQLLSYELWSDTATAVLASGALSILPATAS